MAKIDIRDDVAQVDIIRFAENDALYFDETQPSLVFFALNNTIPRETDAAIYIEDIPDLIKALQKAQELWATK